MRRLAATISLALAAAIVPMIASSSSSSSAAAEDAVVADGPLLSREGYPHSFLALDGSRRPAPADLDVADPVDFSADGASLAFWRPALDGPGTIAVRRADGTTTDIGTVPAGTSPTYLSFAHDGSYVVAVLTEFDPEEQDLPAVLWRFQAGVAPTRLLTLPTFLGNYNPVGWAAGVGSPYFYYGGADGSVKRLDTSKSDSSPTTVTGGGCHDDVGCSRPVDVIGDLDPAHNRLLVMDSGRATGPDEDPDDWIGWSWLDLDDQSIDRWWRFPVNADGSTTGWGAQVSPSGDLVRLVSRDDQEYTRTVIRRSSAGAHVVRTLGESVIAWQPCPGGTCPVFISKGTRPGVPRAVKASSGVQGRPVTARVDWNAPASDGGLTITRYQVDAAKLRPNGSVARHLYRSPTARYVAPSLPAGRYKFRVRAMNAVGYGAWSTYSSVVRAR